MRTLSFILALTAAVTLMLFPFLLHSVSSSRLHQGLPIAMLGIAAAFVWGIGYVPNNPLLRGLFSPLCALILAVTGVWLLFSN